MNSQYRLYDYSTNIIMYSKIAPSTPYKGYKMMQYSHLPNRRIQPTKFKIFDKAKKKKDVLLGGDGIDLFLEGGKVVEQKKEENSKRITFNDRNFNKVNQVKKKADIYTLRPSRKTENYEHPNSVIQKHQKDTPLRHTISQSLQFNEEGQKYPEANARTQIQDGIISTQNVLRLAIYPKEVIPIQKQRKKTPSRNLSKNIKIKSQQKSSNLQKNYEKYEQKKQPVKKIVEVHFTKIQKLSKPKFYLDPKDVSNIKSDSFIVTQYPSGQILFGNYFKRVAEIASLTKIMTFYTIYEICLEFRRDPSEEMIVIDEQAQNTTGTSAQVFAGDVYTVEDLLYGLMLPSGNDAAIALAKWGGSILLGDSYDRDKDKEEEPFVKVFMKHMNNLCRKLKMNSSKFMNPHGLPHSQSGSTPQDLSLLISHCLKIELFQKVISVKKYQCWIDHNGTKHQVIWENTNKLLRRPHFIGGKTGVTISAGPCLASCYELDDKILIIILLKTTKLSRRFKETRYLVGLALSKINQKFYEHRIKQVLKNDIQLDSDNSEDEEAFNYERTDAKQMTKRNKILTFQM